VAKQAAVQALRQLMATTSSRDPTGMVKEQGSQCRLRRGRPREVKLSRDMFESSEKVSKVQRLDGNF
jgi:hypothetical protein